jgi:hypothetical protein
MAKSFCVTFLVIAAAILALDECAGQPPELHGTGPDSAGVAPEWRLERSLTPAYAFQWPAFNANKPDFLKQPVLEQTYGEGFRQRWFAAGSSRTFEAEERSLADYSEIDIPITFPSRIGRVIGQGANLSVSGSEQITFGGQTRYRVNEPETEFGKRSRFPTLDMKQHLKIDLTGTVGEKIHVMVHHDSDIETPLENRIKLKYEGDDDEIVQSIEMGNTNLSIPGSQFVSYSGKQEGLFGAKMLAKVGALDIAAIASKQEGRTAGARFEGAATRDSVILDDLDFVRHKYFYMIHPRDPEFAYPDKDFDSVLVYLDDGNGKNNENAVHGYAFLEPDPRLLPEPAAWDTLPYAYEGDFDILEPNRDYAVDLRTGEISLLRRLEATHTLAVRYVYGAGEGAVRAGGVVQDSLMLKMIRPRDEDMTQKWAIWGEALKYERKNVYWLESTYISEEKVEVTIYRRAPEVEDIEVQGEFKYSQILGIDLRDEAGVLAGPGNDWTTDNYADGGRVNGELGLLIFPDLRPFAPEDPPMWIKPDGLPDLEDTNPVVYDTLYTYLKPQNSKYYMIVRFSTPQTTFKLPHINILENSEVVELNGNRLARNVDYEIYYDIGQIRFKTEEAAEPDARISVDYQYVPFLSLAQQSLVGVQGIYRFSKESHIGTAWLYQSKKSPEERPRLGQEPSKVVMGDFNSKLQFDSDLLTSIVDGLPIVEADKPSRLTLSGEVGMSFPNPNTKGNVYIDDMEGVRDLRSFSVMREAWVPASPPTGLRWQDTRRIWWYVKDDEVQEVDLFPKAESRPGKAKIPVLEINFRDYRYSQDFVTSDPMSDWGGLMRLVSKSGSDYSELKFVEVWLRQKEGDGGMMHIDLGALSENYYNPWEPDSLHDEDKDNDGQLSESEDTGLDGVFGNGEPGSGDDPYDNWGYTAGDYSRINGTEKDPRIVPDTEDLDGDGNLDTDEVHFRLSFDLDDEAYIVSEAAKGWRQYRIPLADAETQGSPSWRSIKYIRFHFTDVDSPAVFQVAYLQIAGASWLDEGIRNKENMAWLPDGSPEEKFEVSAKNTRDDPDYEPPYDPGTDPDGYEKREQSLVLNIKNLEAGHSGSVYRILPGKASDYTLYQTLAFYVHGDLATAAESLYMFVRFGADSLNFYEYATLIAPGWRTIEVPLEEVTNVKMEEIRRDSIYKREVNLRERRTDDGWIRVYGGPSITRVSRISAGIVNQRADGLPSSDSVEVWFDDLRLTDVRKETGFAKRIAVGASLSDVITISADLKQTDTEFQTLSGKRRGSDDTDYSISVSTGIDRFLPNLGLSLPFSMRYHKSQSLPTLKSKSDIALRPEERKDEEKYSIDDSYRLAFSRRGKSGNPLLRLTIDALSGNVSYSANSGRSPELENDSYGYTGGLSYNFSPWWGHSLRIFRGYMISYLPENVTANISGSARTTKRTRIDDSTRTTLEDRYTRDVKGTFSVSFKPFSGPSIETDYSLKTTRDLDLAKKVPLSTSIGRGRELTRSQRAGIRIKRSFGNWMRPTLSYDVNYDENADPKVKSAGDPGGVRRASVSNRSRVDLVLTPGAVFSDSKKPGDTTGVALHRLILSKIPDITAGYVIDRSSKYNKLLSRPSLKFQLGLQPEVDEDLVLLPSSGAAQPTDEFTRKDGMNLSTEFRPLSSLSLDAKYKYDKSLRTYAGSKTFTETAIWPDITGNLSSLTSLSFLQGVLKSSSLVMGYKGSSTARGVGTSETTNRTDKSEWVPLIGWDATWSNGVRTTFNLRRATSETENLQGTRSLQRTRTTSIDVSVRHSFSAPQGMYIPLAGRTLRFKSNLTVSVDVSYETVRGTTPTLGNRLDRDTRKLAILPKASYSFSKNITGSANITFRQDSDRKLGQTFRTIGVSASVLIRF